MFYALCIDAHSEQINVEYKQDARTKSLCILNANAIRIWKNWFSGDHPMVFFITKFCLGWKFHRWHYESIGTSSEMQNDEQIALISHLS